MILCAMTWSKDDRKLTTFHIFDTEEARAAWEAKSQAHREVVQRQGWVIEVAEPKEATSFHVTSSEDYLLDRTLGGAHFIGLYSKLPEGFTNSAASE